MANTRTIKINLLFVDDLVVLHTLRVIYIRTFTLQTPTLPSLPALCGRISCVKGTPSDPIAHVLTFFSGFPSAAPRAMGRIRLSWHDRSHAAAGGMSLLR